MKTCSACGHDLASVDDVTLAMIGVCSEECLVRGPVDPSTDDEWREPFDDEDGFDPPGGGGNF